MKNNNIKIMQWWIFVVAIALSIIGIIALYSALYETAPSNFVRQVVFLVISIIVCLIVAFIDYEKLMNLSPYAYAICFALLILVIFTKKVNGASSWFDLKFFAIQPSEIAKPVFVLFTAFIISKIQKKSKENISKFKYLLLLFVLTIPMIALILLQPDYGTAIGYVIALFCMLIIAGIDKKYFLIGIPLIILSLVLAYIYILPDHAKTRIQTFINPYEDPLGTGYNTIQSKLAIGSGELTGMGILKGNQTQLGYLSPKSTDFIFSVIGEEMGFIGAGTVIILYIALLQMIAYVSKTAKNSQGSVIVIGIFAYLLYHMVENIRMTMGLLPITGIPLPFISYGGSSLLTNFICIGIILNVSFQRQKTIFVGKR